MYIDNLGDTGIGEWVGGVDFTRQKKEVPRDEQMRNHLVCRVKEV